MKCCRVCLTENFNPRPLADSRLRQFAKTLFRTHGLTYLQEFEDRHLMCFECKSRLWDAYTLIQKAAYAQKAMQILEQTRNVTAKSWQNIKNQHGLFSTLGYHKVEIDYCINGNDSNQEAEVELEEVDIKEEEVEIKHEYPENVASVDEFEQNCTLLVTNSRQRKRRGKKRNHIRVTAVRKPYKKKPIIVETGPRPVDVTVEHIVEGKRKRPSLQLIDQHFSDIEDDMEVVPFKKRKKKIDQKYNPDSSDADTDSSKEYYGDTGRPLKIPKRKYPRRCELCDTEVNSGKEHYRHYLYYHEETEYPYKIKKDIICDKCGKYAKTENDLADHARTHLDEKTISCPLCVKMFYSRKVMLKHIQSVHADKRFFCDFCGKGFKVKPDLRLHIRIHTGDKPYKCHICGVAYAHGGNVLVHIRNVHQHYYKPKKKKDTSEEKTKKVGKKKKTSQINVVQKESKSVMDPDNSSSVEGKRKRPSPPQLVNPHLSDNVMDDVPLEQIRKEKKLTV